MTTSPRNDEIAAMRILVDLYGPEGPKEWEPYHYDTAEAAGAVVGRYLDRVEKRAAYQRARSERQVERGEANTRTREGNRRPRPRQRKPEPAELTIGKAAAWERSGGFCEARTPWCEHMGTQAHHKAGRVGKGAHDADRLLIVCGEGNLTGCHGWIHQHVDEAKDLGLLLPRLGEVKPHVRDLPTAPDESHVAGERDFRGLQAPTSGAPDTTASAVPEGTEA